MTELDAPRLGFPLKLQKRLGAVIKLHEEGVSFIKIYELTSPEVFAALVDVANELGLPVDSHVPLSMRASVAGPQVDSIEHLRNIELDCASNASELLASRIRKLQNPDGLSGAELNLFMKDCQQ